MVSPPTTPGPLLVTDVRLGPGGPPADLRIADGRVLDVTPPGADPDGAHVLPGNGATALPGLRDRHVHLSQWATMRRQVDLSGAGSAAQAATLVAGRPVRPGELVSGFGFRDGLWPDQPHKDLLEAALPGQRVALVSADLHSVWLSPAALAWIGLDHPTGLLREQPCWDARAALADVPDSGEVDDWALQALQAAAARGVTGILDFEFTDTVTAWSRRSKRCGRLPVRVEAAIFRPLLEATIEAGLRSGDQVAGTGGLVTVGPCKVLMDGSLNTRTALCRDPYPGMDGPQAHGLLTQDPDELTLTMKRAAEKGIPFAVHAIGDEANRLALDCFAAAGTGGRIEHAQLVDPADLPRFARLGVLASVQPGHAPEDRDVADRHWAGHTADAFPYRSLLAAGATLELGSDAPVSRLDPWYAIACAVRRSADEREAWHAEQALTVEQALACSTGGRLRPAAGMPADLVLTGADPLTVPVTDLARMPVLATVVAGRVVHRAD